MFTITTTFGEIKRAPEFSAFSGFIMAQTKEEAARLEDVSIEEACGNRSGMIAEAANWLLEETAAGKVRNIQIWSDEEKAKDPGKERTGLLFFPAEGAKGRRPYIVLCAGGAYMSVCNLLEAFPSAKILTAKGYNVFALTYRTEPLPLLPNPQEDLAEAVRVIEAHAEELGILPGDYAVCGFSAGAHLAGSFGTDNLGYARYGVAKPEAVILAYPATSAYAFDSGYAEGTSYINKMIGMEWTEEKLSAASVERNMSKAYPPAFVTHSLDDRTVPFHSSELLVSRLEELGVPFRFKPVDGCGHGFSAGFGEAEGWLDEASDFFEEQRDKRFLSSERLSGHLIRIQGACMEYMYLVEGTERCALIDTGTGLGNLRRFVSKLTEKPVIVLLSHGHMDHALGTPGFEEVYMSPKDRQVLVSHSDPGYRKDFIRPMNPALAEYVEEVPVPDCLPIEDGQEWDLGGITIKAYECSGHTVGSVVFLIKEDRMLFLGDACNSNTLVYDPAYSTTVEEYRDSLLKLQRQTEGLYDSTIFSHESDIKGNQLVGHMIALCDKVLSGISDEYLVTFGHDTAPMAKRRNAQDMPLDGSDVNFMYRKDRLYRQ